MRRLLWIVPLFAAIALTGYLLGRPATAPADPARPDSHPVLKQTAEPPAAQNLPSEPPQAKAPGSPDLPITNVTLYSSGVGYFQREGTVDGDAKIDLAFPVNDVNDLLKSMVLQDLGGGHVGAVGYDSHDPLNKTLTGFAVNFAGNPGYADLLNQARGEKVEVMANRSWGLQTLKGTVVGVEAKHADGKDAAKVDFLNLWCEGGACAVPLAQVVSVKFLNPNFEREAQRALEVLAGSHDTQKKAVSLHFRGTGQRQVRVGYVVETPLWRTSYRLLVDKNGKLFVQGWALVENPTSEDWKDVRMSLVSGRPISFQMDLYQPLYAPRPVVQTQLNTAIVPVNHGQAQAAGGSAPSQGAITKVTNLEFRSPSWKDGLTNSTANGDFTGHIGGWIQYDNVMFNQAAQLQNAAVRLDRGVTSAASAKDLGDSYQYAIEHPVTIPRQKSAMLPIVNKGLDGDRVSVYSPQAHAKHPLLALRLKNTSGVHLTQGPVAVFEGTGYAGDAQMPDLRPGEERLVSYALDLGTEVDAAPGEGDQRLVSIKLHKGVLSASGKVREALTYTVKNRGTQDRVVLIEHPRRPGYKLACEAKPKEKAKDVYRFEVKVEAGKTVKLEVAEEKDLTNQTPLAGCPVETVRYLLQCEFDNGEAKAALEKLVEQNDQIQMTRSDLGHLQQKLADIANDQARLRANLKEMPSTAAAYKRYLEKFDTQETAIEKLQEQIQGMQARLQKEQGALDAYLNGLDLQATIRKAPPLPQRWEAPMQGPRTAG
jgi:hypothetical protein